MMIDDKTANRQYPLINPANLVNEDIYRLISAFQAIDIDVANMLQAIAGKAAEEHTHPLAGVVGLLEALASKQAGDARGVANGYAALGADGKVPTAQLPASVFGAMAYQGVWNAAANSPAIPAASSANKGFYFKISVDGATNINGETDWKVGDWIVSNGASWDKIDNTDQVGSVAGLVGVITVLALQQALGLGSAAYVALNTLATAMQGGKADTAVQPVVMAAADNLRVPIAGATGLGGFSATPVAVSASITLSQSTGNYHPITNNGAMTIAAPTGTEGDSYFLVITNGATAGAVTFSGFTVEGDTILTTAGKKYFVSIARIGSDAMAFVKGKP